jgi:hypothetical protein
MEDYTKAKILRDIEELEVSRGFSSQGDKKIDEQIKLAKKMIEEIDQESEENSVNDLLSKLESLNKQLADCMRKMDRVGVSKLSSEIRFIERELASKK